MSKKRRFTVRRQRRNSLSKGMGCCPSSKNGAHICAPFFVFGEVLDFEKTQIGAPETQLAEMCFSLNSDLKAFFS